MWPGPAKENPNFLMRGINKDLKEREVYATNEKSIHPVPVPVG